MVSSFRWRSIALAATLSFGCVPTVTKDQPVAVSSATIARFSPDGSDPCNSVLPFPSDLAKNAKTGKLDLPYCKSDGVDQIAIKTGLRTLDGYAVGTSLKVNFTGALDAASLAAGVKLFSADGKAVEIDAKFLPDSDNLLVIQPRKPLAEATKYLAAITTDVKDSAGKPVASDQAFVFLKSENPLTDSLGYSAYSALTDAEASALEKLRQGFLPMFTALESAGLPRSQIAVAWSFTTQTVHATLPQLAALVNGNVPAVTHDRQMPAAAHPLIAAAGIPHSHMCDLHTGRVQLKTLQGAAGTFEATSSGAPAVGAVEANYLFITPNADHSASPAACTAWAGGPVAVFVHGLGRCKNDVLALANSLNKAGLAVLSVDGPRAGGRSVSALGDQNLDSCPDQPAMPELIALPGQGPNPFAVRDGLREWGLELSQIVNAVKASSGAFVGGSATSNKVALIGHSWGAMAAALASSVVVVDALILNAGSAELGAVFAPGIMASVPSPAMAAESIAAFRWAMEPGDPLYAGGTTKPVLVQVVSGDKVTAEAPLHASDTQTLLAKAFAADRAASTFAMSAEPAGSKVALCDSGTAIVGALLQPCVADKNAALYAPARLKTAGMQRQVATFAISAILGQPVVCDPDFTKSCP